MKLNNEQIIEIHSLFDSNAPSKEIFNQFSGFSKKAIDKVIRESGRSFSERTKKNKTILDNKIYELFDNNSTVAIIVAQTGKDSQYVKRTLKNRDPNVDFGRRILFPNKEEQEEILEFFNDGVSFDDMIRIYENKYSKHALKEVIRGLGISLRRKKPAYNRIHTTKEQDNKILELFDNDTATVDIIKEVNISESVVLRVLKENDRDFKSRSKKIYYDGHVNHNKINIDEDEVLKLYDEGVSVNKIAASIKGDIRGVLSKYRSTISKNDIRNITLTDEEIIKKMWFSGSSSKDISKSTQKYSPKQIIDFVNKMHWLLSDEIKILKMELALKKATQTLNERYNVDNPWQIPEVKAKSQTSEVIEYRQRQIEDSNLKTYGVKNVFEVDYIKSIIKETMIENWGHKNHMQNEEFKSNFKWNNQFDTPEETYLILYNKQAYTYVWELCGSCPYTVMGYLEIGLCLTMRWAKQHKLKLPKVSKPERLIHEILDEFGVKYEKSNRSLLNGKELDVYIPELNLAIEVNGMYWHSTKFKENSYHLSKTKVCDKLGIQLLHFWDMEIINNFDLVKNFIRNKVKKNENKIFARKCKVVEISQKVMKDFLNKNHLQQFSDAKFKYALEYNGQLVSIMTFSATRFNKNYDYELVRFCSLANHNIIGGAQKLLSAFRKKNQGSIVSYAQRNYSTGSIYETLGFTLDGTSAPSPVYLNGSEIFRRGSSKAYLYETLTCYTSGNYRYILK